MSLTETTARTVTNSQELARAIEDKAQHIAIDGTIEGSPSVTLPEGTTLSGGTLKFLAKGLRLSRNNTLRDVTIETTDYEAAIYNDTTVADAGTLRLENVSTIGQVYLVAEENLQRIHVDIQGLHVRAADVRGRFAQPHGFNVDVLQGGLTLWNRQPNQDATFSTTVHDVAIGTPETPVRGSGVFVAGYADRSGALTGGALTADVIETADVYTDGGIAPGTPDKISGGVFVVSGAQVHTVRNSGTVVTHGQNDMVLDNWGEVDEWIATAEIRSTGPSGIGFVNFGKIGLIDIQAPIITEGKGARGFNLYDGSLREARFDSITTTGDGSIGIQVSKPLDRLLVRGDVETRGGEGLSLVLGVQVTLQAIALSVKPGGAIGTVEIAGQLITHGDNVTTLEVAEGGEIQNFSAASISAQGENSTPENIAGHLGRA